MLVELKLRGDGNVHHRVLEVVLVLSLTIFVDGERVGELVVIVAVLHECLVEIALVGDVEIAVGELSVGV